VALAVVLLFAALWLARVLRHLAAGFFRAR
jgi:hypothetical protein